MRVRGEVSVLTANSLFLLLQPLPTSSDKTLQPPKQPLQLRRVLAEPPGHAAAGPRRATAQAPSEQWPHVLHQSPPVQLSHQNLETVGDRDTF